MSKDANRDYHNILNRIEENMLQMDNSVIKEYLDELFSMKPVRLKWFLVNAKLMLKEKKSVDEVIAYLSDKCELWYDYEGIDQYFEMMSSLYEMNGDFLESKRFIYQHNKLKDKLHGINGNNQETDEEKMEHRSKLLAAKSLKIEDIRKMAELYYISGNIYLYMLWSVLAIKSSKSETNEINDKMFGKFNVEYYYERLVEDKSSVFVIMATSMEDEADCRLAQKALQQLHKTTFLLKEPAFSEGCSNSREAVKRSLDTLRARDGGYEMEVYYTDENQEDTRLGIFRYLAESYSAENLITVVGSGLLLDMLCMEKGAKPQLERLTPAEADYLEENMAVGRYGDYLSYIANIYKTSGKVIREELFKKPSCRFSIIIPCRNESNTLYYTLKTCLNQSFTGEYEIVISDNSDMSWGMDTPTYRICQKIQDSRIKYYRTPGNLSLIKNFEYGYLKSQGEFLISMGADDGILPWALEKLDGIITNYPHEPIILWHEVYYKWADVSESTMVKTGTAVLETSYDCLNESPEVIQYDPMAIFLKCLENYPMLYFLPQLYHNSGIRRDYLGTLYKKTGVLWAGISQDICMAVTTGNLEQSLTFVECAFTIMGISNASIGMQCRTGSDNLLKADVMQKIQSTYAQGWRVPGFKERFFPVTGGEYSGLYACVLYANSIGAISDELVDAFDWKSMYKKALLELNRDDIMYDRKMHRLRYAVSLHGTEMSDWFESLSEVCLTPQRTETKEENGAQNNEYQEYIVISGNEMQEEPFTISDIYKVSLYLERLYRQEGEKAEK